ncbi:MAG: DUF4942 domain-containing protein, partial [Oscillospiraceae bacterium]|nr:DUF4942 domain-containing protein [Oscillospiraceae bacterium]
MENITNIETLEPEEFAAKYLPVLEARDAAQATPTKYFSVGFEDGGIYSVNIITSNVGDNDLAAVNETAERHAQRYGYKVAFVEEKPEWYVNECRAKGTPIYPIDDEAQRKYGQGTDDAQDEDDFGDIDPVEIRESLKECGIVDGEVVDPDKLTASPFIQQVTHTVEVLQDETPVDHSPRTALDAVSMTSGERARKTFYPTPEALAEKLLAGVKWNYIESVLEPSAGKGDLARYVAGKLHYSRRHYPPHDEYSWRDAIREADIDCVEIDPALRNVLEGGGFRVVHDDFLTYETQKRYHLIVMNPPFDQGAEHLLKALELSERGGLVYCILNAETLRNPCTQRRVDLAKKLQAYGAEIEYASGAFQDAERKTDVDVALVRVNIPHAKVDSTIMDDMRKAPTYKSQRVPNEYTEIAHYDEIEKWVNMYNYEVACGIRLIEEWEAMREAMRAVPELSKHEGDALELKIGQYSSSRDVTINEYLRQTRGKYWRMIFQQPVITDKLTSNLQNELHDQVVKLMNYEFSAYNILTLIIKMNGKIITGIEDTIVALFDDWTRMYWHEDSPNRHYYNGWRTNDCFRVGKKVILPFYDAYDSWDNRFKAYRVVGKFRDIEKVFDFLDSGRTEWAGTLGDAIQQAENEGATRNIDTKYFKATFYKKGTAHLVFKDMDLLEKFNMFASRKKGWLPPEYGRKRYQDMSDEERRVIDSFQGREKYEEVMTR